MKEKKMFITGIILVILFWVFTALISTIDVQPIGQNGTNIGFATINCLFHRFTDVNMMLYNITDWLGLVPILCCFGFGITGFIQLIKRKSLFKVDTDIILSGIYYIIIILLYLIFEAIPINYRPVLIDGTAEASYPSSTIMLVLSVMPTISFLIKRRIKNNLTGKVVNISIILFSLFMIIGRTLSGVHWLTDITGSVILSAGLYLIYKWSVLFLDKWRL